VKKVAKRQSDRLKEALAEMEEQISIKMLRVVSGEFTGFYENGIWENRVIIPAAFRELIKPHAKKTVYVAFGPDGSVGIYPLDSWVLLKNKRKEDPQRANKFLTILERYAMPPQVLEGPGRIRIRDDLLKRANITDKLIIAGNNHYMS